MQHEKRTILQHDNEMNIPPTTLLHQHTTEIFFLFLSNHRFPFLQLLRVNMKIQLLEMSLMFCSAVVRLDFHCHHESLNLSLRKEN